jgi:hypothetical protein
MTKEKIKERIDDILKSQSELEQMVIRMQDDFFNEVIVNYQSIATSQRSFNTFFRNFNQKYQAPIFQKILKDLLSLIESNVSYFKSESSVKNVDIASIRYSLSFQFGISDLGGIEPQGYLSDLILDTSVRRNFRAGLMKFSQSGRNTRLDVKQIEMFIKGDEKTYGIWESFYSKEDKGSGSIFDVYQKADRMAQNQFSNSLGMQAQMYVGGLMTSSRTFCEERNGKIFLGSEIKDWSKLQFQGRPKTGYVPEIDLGGYKCRHHLSALSNATAMRLDPTIKEDSNGNLYRI